MILNDLLLRLARITAPSLQGLLIIRPLHTRSHQKAQRRCFELVRIASPPGLTPFAPAPVLRPKLHASWERFHQLRASITPGPEEPSTTDNLRYLPPRDLSTQSIMSSGAALESCVQNLAKADLHLAPVRAIYTCTLLLESYEEAETCNSLH